MILPVWAYWIIYGVAGLAILLTLIAVLIGMYHDDTF